MHILIPGLTKFNWFLIGHIRSFSIVKVWDSEQGQEKGHYKTIFPGPIADQGLFYSGP